MEYLLEKIPASHGVQTLVGLAAIIVGTLLASVILRSVLFSFVAKLTSKTETSLDDRLLKGTRLYLSLLVYVFGLSLLLDFVQARFADYVGSGLTRIADSVVYGAGIIIVAILVVKVVSALLEWYSDAIAGKTDTKLDDEFVPLLERTIKIVITILAVLMVLDYFGVDIKGLVAVLGVGSLAVALASQETLANMIGGFTIMIDRPFRAGDLVRLADGRRVLVHEIGIRSTKFLTYDNTLVIVPNAELIKSTVHNITYPMPRVRVVVDVGVGYDSDIHKVRKAMLDEAHKHANVMKEPEPEFYFLNFGDSSLDVSLRCHVARAEHHRRTSSELRIQILERFRSDGIEIPFPQRVVTMVREDPDSD